MARTPRREAIGGHGGLDRLDRFQSGEPSPVPASSTALTSVWPPSTRLTVITAPAGSGKDRLVREWLAQPGPDGRRPDGVRIDLGPQDRGRSALNEAVGWLSAAERVWPRLVLTGLELPSVADVTSLVSSLLDGLPPRVRVVLVSVGSGLPAAMLVRFGADLAQLRATDLWWPRADLIEQLARRTGITATEAEAEQLFRLTAGWPAGAILLGRAMRTRPAVLAAPDLTEEAEILDFVTTEILDRLAPPVRRFVTRTSVLVDLEIDDCVALVPDENPHLLLAQVHRQALTADQWPPVTVDPPAVRYHRLIRAAALRQLRAGDVDAERRLLRRAGEQARLDGREPTAVGYLSAGEDWDAALELLRFAAANGFRGWEPTRLRAAVARLPDRVWAQDAERRALIAFAAAMAGDQLFAGQVLRQTPSGLRDSAGWWSVIARLIEALPGPAGSAAGGYRAACSAVVELRTLDRSIPIPPILGVVDRPSLIGMAHLLAARAGVFDRDQISVRRHLEAGWSEPGAQMPRYCLLAGLGADALTAAWGGQLTASRRRAARAQRLAEESGLTEHPMLSLTLLARAEWLRARGRSSQALAELDAAAGVLSGSEPFVVAASGGRVHTAAAQILRAMLHLDRAESESARAELAQLDAEGDDDPPRNLSAARAVAWARFHLVSDDVTAAEQVLSGAPATGAVFGTRIAVALRQPDPEAAQVILADWPFEDTLDNRIRRLLSAVAVEIALGRRSQAGELLEQALLAAEPDEHIQVFLDAPARARAMASAVLNRSRAASGWRVELADRLELVRNVAGTGAVPVTRREQAVLEHLTTTMTHAEISRRLFISDNTLKSHCRNLYRKLGVNTRAEAVRVARTRGWLAPACEPGPAVGASDSSPRGDVVLDVNITPDPVGVDR